MDRFWADPFIWVDNNKSFIFVEEYLYDIERGRIACLELDRDLNLVSNTTILERPYHLSYPFIFEYSGKLYMIPEAGETNSIQIFRCVHFPDKWIFEKKLIDNIYAVDSTVVYFDNLWWLFANVKSESGSTFDTLNLYYSKDPLSSNWHSHPCNPIVKDIRSARPAGRIFLNETGQLIRPSQDCNTRYGYAINFNRIVTLNTKEYQETSERIFRPPLGWRILAAHTFNNMNKITVIDASQRRKKLGI